MNDADKAQRDDRIIADFMQALQARDFGAMRPVLSAQLVYRNMPWPALDFDATCAFYADFFPRLDSYRVDVLRQHATPAAVCNERLEYFYYTDLNGGCIELPVAGFFELDGAGKITGWRDYFDLQTWQDQGGRLPG